MRKIITFIVANVLCTVAVNAQAKIPVEEAPKHIGETVTICSKVFGGRFIENSQTKPTLLNLGGAFPNHKLTILISSEDRKNFAGKPEEDYLGKTVCVTGKLIDYKGKPEIVVSKPREIQVQNDGGTGNLEIRTKDFFWFE